MFLQITALLKSYTGLLNSLPQDLRLVELGFCRSFHLYVPHNEIEGMWEMFLPTSGCIVFSFMWIEQWTNFIWWFDELFDKNMAVDWVITDCCLGVKYQESSYWVPWEKNILLPTVVSCAIVTREKYFKPACTLSLVRLPTSPSCFISTLLLALWLCAQPQILGAFMVQGWAGGPMGRDPFNTLDMSSGTLFLVVSGMPVHSHLLSPNWKPTFCLLHTDLSFFLLFFTKPLTSNACICRVFMCVYMCLCAYGVCAHACSCVHACAHICVYIGGGSAVL